MEIEGKIEALNTAIENLCLARSLNMVTSAEWLEVTNAYASLTGKTIEWRTHDEINLFTERSHHA